MEIGIFSDGTLSLITVERWLDLAGQTDFNFYFPFSLIFLKDYRPRFSSRANPLERKRKNFLTKGL